MEKQVPIVIDLKKSQVEYIKHQEHELILTERQIKRVVGKHISRLTSPRLKYLIKNLLRLYSSKCTTSSLYRMLSYVQKLVDERNKILDEAAETAHEISRALYKDPE